MVLTVDALAFGGEENSMSKEFGRSTVGTDVIREDCGNKHGCVVHPCLLDFHKSDRVEMLSRAKKAS